MRYNLERLMCISQCLGWEKDSEGDNFPIYAQVLNKWMIDKLKYQVSSYTRCGIFKNRFTPGKAIISLEHKTFQGLKVNGNTLMRRSEERTIKEHGSIKQNMKIDVALKFFKIVCDTEVKRKPKKTNFCHLAFQTSLIFKKLNWM